MQSIFRALFACFLLAVTQAHAAVEVAGVRFEERTALDGQTLVLNGAGLRTRLMFKVYAMGLYLPAPVATAEAALAATGPQRIRIVTLRELTATQFIDALVDGLEANHTAAELAALQPAIASFRSAMLAVGDARSGTEVLLDRIPGTGTRLTVAGARHGEDIPGDAFYPALLRIWLGERPVQADLKKRLLGAVE